jgi:cytochrome c oxidase subunit 4
MSVTDTEPDVVYSEPDATGEHGHGSDRLYVIIFVVLFALTALEVSTYFVDFGPLHLPVLLVLMVIKFTLVVMFFMHLKFDNRLFTWVFGAGLVLAVAVYCAMLTTFQYWQKL